MLFRVLAAIFIAASYTAAAPVNITGRILDQNGSPLSGARVSIRAGALVDTSGPDGRFKIAGETDTRVRQTSGHRGQASSPCALAVIDAHKPIIVTIRDLRSRIVDQRRFRVQKNGRYRVNTNAMLASNRTAAGIHIICARNASSEIVFAARNLSRTASEKAFTRLSASSTSHAAHGKKAACTVSLTITAAGYQARTLEDVACVEEIGDVRLSLVKTFTPGGGGLDLDKSNRREAVHDLPAFGNAGVDQGAGLPSLSKAAILDAAAAGVVADDQIDDTQPLQDILDSLAGTNANRTAASMAVVQLPSGEINLSREITIEANYTVIRGNGADPSSPAATRIVFRPDLQTRYDVIDHEGVPDLEGMAHKGNSMGWNWPGRGAFRVQTTAVSEKYESEYREAPANRKDIYEGSVNFHWTSGLNVDQDVAFPAREGDSQVRLDNRYDSNDLQAIMPGAHVWIGAANSEKMYREQHVPAQYWERLHMKTQIFKVVSVNAATRTITIDKPLEFDLPANSAADGSSPIGGSKPYPSRVVPLRVVTSVGFENCFITLDLQGLPSLDGGVYRYTAEEAAGNYGNMAPEYAMHGLVFKWAVDCWVRNVRTHMTGSHPIVAEQVRHLDILDSYFDGSWNKGGGGNGYVRLARAWDCVVYNNTLRNLRHLTLQWSSSGNVIIGNDLDCEINLHGGWERNNLIELNRVLIPYGHAHTNCQTGCDHITTIGQGETWYPIYWSTGAKAGKWSGSSGPRNIFFNNVMKKQTTPGGPYEDYEPYYRSDGASRNLVFQFGWDRESERGSHWVHLAKNGDILADWAGNETVDYSRDPHAGVNANVRYEGESLFLRHAPRPIE